MKVLANPKDKTFMPIELVLVLETQEELNAIYSIFNHCDITDWLCKATGSRNDVSIRKSLEDAYGGKVPYESAHWALVTKLKL